MPSSRGSSDRGIEPTSPALAGGFFTTEPPGKPQESLCVNEPAASTQLPWPPPSGHSPCLHKFLPASDSPLDAFW